MKSKLFKYISPLLMLGLLSAASAQGAVKSDAKPTQELASYSALLVDTKTNEVLYASNPHQVVPIASISKLMTAMVTLDAKLPLGEKIAVEVKDNPEMKNVVSRIRLGSTLSRKEAMLLTLMSSENRAATTLAHHYPGGYQAFVKAMNTKAKALGMTNTRFVEPTGLSVHNVSTAADLVRLLKAAQDYPLLGQLSSTPSKSVTFGKPRYSLAFYNTNRLVNKDNWDIRLTKTGFTDAAGHCLVMLTRMAKRDVAFVVLDSFGKQTHLGDAGRLKKWLETGKVSPLPDSAKTYKEQRKRERNNKA
ncbi:D-alanyl-D-alanine endopeptidase [Shewanella sp. FJAT-52076]|nr:D-alanyl-D-alanine endopeptidase [Shewanella sp. FJAT-52076]QYJ75494.1 D-alanyl-D-alanine endopeptidase [Shewanella sp. FJAT-52076]